MKRNVFVLLLCLLTTVAVVFGINLQQEYNNCGAGEGYDKLLILDGNKTYEGGLGVLQGKKSCIRGNGALCDLNGQVYISQPNTYCVVTGCCFINGGLGAIHVADGAEAVIDGNTICKSVYGINAISDASIVIKNNIIYGFSKYGIVKGQYNNPTILYNDVYPSSYWYFCPG